MRRMLASLSLALILQGVGSAAVDPCEKAKRGNGWCRAAAIGYVAGVAVPSKRVFEALDVHGHAIVPAAVTCPVCRKALPENGYCPAHRMGFVGGRAYLSRMTYELARSKRIEPSTLQCPVCLRHVQGIGWCDRHRRGIAGRFAWSDAAAFADFEQAYGILLSALELLPACETCAAAMVANGYCAAHRLKFDQGRSGTLPSP